MYISERTIEYTRRFYEWERRGRGWDIYDAPVHPEPPLAWPSIFVPTQAETDDTRQTTILSRLFSKREAKSTQAQLPEPEEALVEAYYWPEDLVEHTLLLPKDFDLIPVATAAWLSSLQTLSAPLVYELVGQGGQVEQRLSCQPKDSSVLGAALGAVAPQARLEVSAETLIDRWKELPSRSSALLEFGLGREFVLPLQSGALRPSILASLMRGLSELGANELGVLQVVFAPTKQPWAEAIASAVTTPSGQPFFADAPEITKQAADKISAPLFAATLRLAVFAESQTRAFDTVRTVAAGLGRLSATGGNELVPLGAPDEDELEADILLRSSSRTGMILSLPELSQLVSLPTKHEETPSLTRIAAGKPAPERLFEGDGARIGRNPSSRRTDQVRLPIEDRLSHVHVLGATGTGKSTLLSRMILADIENGHGVAVLDPHGDLVDEILGRIPESRTGDCIVFDPSNPDTVVGWNILSATSEPERQMLASDLVASFRRLATSWGDQMTSLLSNAVLSFLDSDRGGTLLDLRRFLTDKAFRDEYIPTIQDDYLASYWTTEFPLIVGRKPQGPILTRLDTLLRSKLVRDVVTTREKHLDFRAMMDERRIFLGRLSQGAIGEENAALLGSLLASKFQQTALSRQNIPERDRAPFFLFLDEVQEIATPSIAKMLSGVRKYGLGLTASHQNKFQLRRAIPELEHALLDNAHTRIYFRLGDKDARELAEGFSSFTASDIMALKRGEAVCRVGGSTHDFDLRTERLPDIVSERSDAVRVRVIEKSLKRWGAPRPKGTLPKPEPTPQPKPPVSTPVQASVPAPSVRGEDLLVGESQPSPPKATTEGRGGPEHQYLQSLIRESAKQRGYKVDLEYELAEGGRVDLVLSRDKTRLAVEVSVSTSSGHEVENVQKCLAAGFDTVFVVSLKKKFLTTISRRLDELLGPEERVRVKTVTPENLLAQLSDEPIAEQTVAGYRVRTSVSGTVDSETKERRERLARVIRTNAARLKQKK